MVVALGQDSIRDLWSPYGSGDMLERSMLLAWRTGFRHDEDLGLAWDAATFGGAHALGLHHYGLDVGCQAAVVLVPVPTVAEAVVAHPPRSLVVKRGVVVRGVRRSDVRPRT